MTESPKRPVQAYRNPGFLNSKDARELRILAEDLEPKSRFHHHKVDDTIVFMGSARIKSRETAEEMLRKAKAGKDRERAQMALKMSAYYEAARELASRLTKWSKELDREERRFVVCTGGGPGIMEAANRGAAEAGGPSVGLSIQLPHEQTSNRYISPDLSFMFHYFFMRKLWFAQLAKALIVFPGGFGTMDELWEMLTLLQTGKLAKQNIILIYGRKYWDEVLNWKAMVRWGTINEDEYKMLQFADTVDEAFDHIRAGLEKYHMDLDPFLQAY